MEAAIATEDTYTVSLMAHHESESGVFEDVILGTYPDEAAAMAAAKAKVTEDPEATAQVVAALPTDKAFTSWDSLRAMVYTEEHSGLIVESF